MKKLQYILLLLIASVTFSFAQNKTATMEDMWQLGTFYPASFDDFYSMNDGESYTMLANGIIIEQYSFKTGKKIKEVLNINTTKSDTEKPTSIKAYEFSKDESKILITTDIEKIYRHSQKAENWVYDLKTAKITKLSENGKQMLASFSPDGNQVAFVRDNNLFVKNLVNQSEKQITTDGKWASIINGAPDWVYEEEFSFSKAFEWSNDSKFIAFMKFDESKVKEYQMTMYGSLYPESYNYKYPKAGEDNSVVSLHVYNTESGKVTEIECGKENDQYIPRIKWTPVNGVLSFIRLNRLQNHLEILFADVNTGKVNKVLDETDKCYFEITDNWVYTKDNHLLWLSDKDGFYHIYLYDFNGNLVKQITTGNYDVTGIDGYDEANGNIYYTSAEVSPTERQMYSIKRDGTGKTMLTKDKGVNKVQFSKGYKYYVNTFSSSAIPPVTTLYSSNGKMVRILEENAELKAKLLEYNFQKREYFTFKTPDDIELYGWTIKPAGFDENKKYPVFMTVYGGPGAQETLNEWSYTDVWYQVLASKGYVVACVDGRGTGGRGSAFKKVTYGQLGKYEAIDQAETAKYLATQKWVDSKRIGIYGWSFGGYLSSLCLFTFPDLFKMAVAVAPVANWRYYDSIYTERYNGLPKKNPEGYDQNSPTTHVKKLKGKFLLVHGTADDNVHFQNSMELVTKLVESNKQFDSFFYPNSNHGIYSGRNTRYHLFSQMTNYILENL